MIASGRLAHGAMISIDRGGAGGGAGAERIHTGGC